MVYSYRGILVPPIEKEILSNPAVAWLNLEDAVMSGRSQTQKDKYHVTPWSSQFTETEEDGEG